MIDDAQAGHLIWHKVADLAARLSNRSESAVDNQGADVIVSHIEVVRSHGVGALLCRIFKDRRDLLMIRSRSYHDGAQDLPGEVFEIAHDGAQGDYFRVLRCLGDRRIGRVLCVPYFPDDVRTALALKECYGAAVCCYLMDDQNLVTEGIPDHLLKRLFMESDVVFGISRAIVNSYSTKFQVPLHYLPPVAPANHIVTEPTIDAWSPDDDTGVIVGNIWGKKWLERLREVVRESRLRLQWHAFDPLKYHDVCASELARDGIHVSSQPALSDVRLIEAVRRAPFVVVPTGELRGDDDREFLARSSLPSRMTFIIATAHTPMLVVGHEKTMAAVFTVTTGTGICCSYDTRSFREAVSRLCDPDEQLKFRQRAASISACFSDEGIEEWIWESMRRRRPLDERFEAICA